MLRRQVDGTCPICHEQECPELQPRGDLTAWKMDSSSSWTDGRQIQGDRNTKVTVLDRVWHDGFLAYTYGDRVERFHADELGAAYASDEELREVSLDEYIKAKENEDAREQPTEPDVREQPKKRATRRPRAKGSETKSETS